MEKYSSRAIIQPLIVLLILFSVKVVCADDMSGKLYLNHYMYKDSSTAPDYQISTVRLRFKAKNFGTSNTAFNLDTRYKKKWGSRDYLKNNIPYDFNTLNLEFTKVKGRYDILAGRFSVPEIWTETMDGLSLNQRITDGMKIGLFGGFKPDSYSNGFNKDYSGAGAYLLLENKKGRFTFSTANDYYKGKTDRQHLDMTGNYTLFPKVRLSSNLVLDYDTSDDGFDITNLNLNMNFRPIKPLRMTLGYSRFSALKLQESMDFDLDQERQESWSLRMNYAAPKGHFLYFNYRYNLRKIDNKKSSLYLLGLRKRNLFETGMNFQCRYTYNDSYTWTRNSQFFEISRNLFERLDLALSFDQSDYTSDLFDNKRKVKLYAFSADLLMSKKTYLFINTELSEDEEWTTTSLFSGLTYKF